MSAKGAKCQEGRSPPRKRLAAEDPRRDEDGCHTRCPGRDADRGSDARTAEPDLVQHPHEQNRQRRVCRRVRWQRRDQLGETSEPPNRVVPNTGHGGEVVVLRGDRHRQLAPPPRRRAAPPRWWRRRRRRGAVAARPAARTNPARPGPRRHRPRAGSRCPGSAAVCSRAGGGSQLHARGIARVEQRADDEGDDDEARPRAAGRTRQRAVSRRQHLSPTVAPTVGL